MICLDDDARQILSRSISTKHCIKIWAQVKRKMSTFKFLQFEAWQNVAKNLFTCNDYS